jgi:8-hydroxy-5-deazaflavin:NADPH oxidoreductase
MKIGIIGKGNVGTALSKGLSNAGHEIKFGHRDPKEPVEEAAKWGDLIIIAVPFSNVPEVANIINPIVDGKVVLDVTNALDENMELAIGCTTSGAEQLKSYLPKARIVKAFNTVFAINQSKGRLGDTQLSLFVASDDEKAKQLVMQLGKDIGFEPVDGGSLKAARYLEPMGVFMISLGYKLGMGTGIGYKLLKSK